MAGRVPQPQHWLEREACVPGSPVFWANLGVPRSLDAGGPHIPWAHISWGEEYNPPHEAGAGSAFTFAPLISNQSMIAISPNRTGWDILNTVL